MSENRIFRIFEDYTNSVCRKIMSPKKKIEVREELYSHLLEEYERNSALGLDEDSAQQQAIKKMGDENQIANDFGELYSINPIHYIKSTFNIIIAGILLTTFTFNFLPEGLPDLLSFIGTAFLIYGLAKIRKIEKQFNKAMWLVVTTHIASTTSSIIAMYIPKFDPINIWALIISLALKDLFFLWIFSGTKNICEKISTNDNSNKPRTFLAFCMWIGYSTVFYVAYIYEFPQFLYLGIIPIITMLYQLNKAKKFLLNDEIDIEKPLIKADKIICLIMVFIMAIMPIFIMIGVENIDPKSTVYSPADTDVSQTEIIYARNHLSELGLPKNHIDDLPDSEVLKYTYSTYMKKDYTHQNYENDMNEITAMYFFFFPDHTVRTLMYVELSDNLKTNHRNGLYMMLDEGFVPINNNSPEHYTDSHGKFFLALSEKKGKTYSSDYFTEYEKENMSYRITGNEFSFPDNTENRRAYIAHTGSAQENNLYIKGIYFYQRIPFRTEWLSFNKMAETNLVDGIKVYQYKKALYTRNISNCIEYFPEYCEN